MIKGREHALRTFSSNVPSKTCVVFFPHTVRYVTVEKPRNGNEGANPSAGPAMAEKRVCEVANSCALKYEELVVVEAKDVQLTEDTLDEVNANGDVCDVTRDNSVAEHCSGIDFQWEGGAI